MDCLSYIVWNPDLTAFFGMRWYSLCWLVGLLLAYLIVRRLYKEQGISQELFDPLFVYCFVGILIGSRLGHCLFYQPDYFLSSWQHVVEMVLPIRFVADGGVKFTGYEGLASHGGTIGLIIALWLYVRKTKLNIWRVLDNIAIATPTTACLIRLGNLMNSEIIGKVTDVPWAFIFERVDPYPRHPGQLDCHMQGRGSCGKRHCILAAASASRTSSPPASSSSTPRRYRKPSRPACRSTWASS